MSTTIKLVIGLPGSGKSHYLANLDSEWAIVDDPLSRAVLPKAKKNLKLAIADQNFCLSSRLVNALTVLFNRYATQDNDYDIVFELVWFENSPKQCIENAQRRVNKPVEEQIKYLSKHYDPPENALPVWKPNQQQF